MLVPDTTAKPAGEDIGAAIWLSIPQSLSGLSVAPWFGGQVREKVPMAFFYGKEDAKAANCISCHTSYGRQSPYKFDDWGTLTKARDLTQGVFRGGRRPVDIYFRIHSGISGSGMNSFGTVIAKKENIWDLVNFVQTLPYTAMRNKLGMQLD